MKAGPIGIVCPVCEETIPVPIECEIENGENAWLGTATLNCTPDMSDLWAHMWGHEAVTEPTA